MDICIVRKKTLTRLKFDIFLKKYIKGKIMPVAQSTCTWGGSEPSCLFFFTLKIFALLCLCQFDFKNNF